ncbi:MAG: AAA family ATPase [Betaproteobacteria bacterium]|nr:MAG: AAA family ATPase [Betaproteobacteria bacterium]
MQCAKCNAENPADAAFCEDCGAKLELACPHCGASVSSGKKFCRHCGESLGPGSVASESASATPRIQTPAHLAERILMSKASMEGERKQVTVLFADLKGSMELLADRDPEEARKILDPVLERMMEAVHHYEGTVNQVMGDGIMALFGAPLAHEDHAVRACYAALRMQESVRAYGEEARRTHGVEVQIRVGLNSGDVVVRSVGSDLRMDYSAVGQTTHLAARMEQLAPPGSVRMTADTMRLAEGFVEVRSLGLVPVKGLQQPVETFELAGAGSARTRLQAAALRGLTRFIGRDAEIEHLRRVLEYASAGQGQVVAIVGEAGVGKSRLTYEFTHSHRVQDWMIVQASSVSYGKATSYLPVIDLLRGYFGIGDRDTHREMRDKVLGRVLGLERGLEPLLSPLLALLNIPVEDPRWQNLDPPQRRQRTLESIKRLLLREAQEQPLLVVFEDLHWIDSETQALLDSLVESLGSARVLLLVNYRPEYQHRWGSKTLYSQLRLDALPAESTEQLLEALLGHDSSIDPVVRLLSSQGNPFYLEEIVRTLAETGVLAGERGSYHLTRPVETVQVPAAVQTLLAARMDRLPQETKQLLQTASAIGKDVPHVLLIEISEQSQAQLEQSLDRLRAAEFMYETRLFPDLEFTFKHALTHEVAYGSLLQEQRKVLHQRIVEAIERVYADRLGEYVERLAYHAMRGQLWDKAVHYNRQAGRRALDHSAAREALSYFEQVQTALKALPESRERTEQLIDLCFEQRAALHPLGELREQAELLAEACALAESIGDQRRLARVLAFQANPLDFLGEHARASEAALRARSLAQKFGDVGLSVVANHYLGQSLFHGGDPCGAIEPLRNMIALSDEAPPGERFGLATVASAAARIWLTLPLVERGEFTEATMIGSEAINVSRNGEHAISQEWAESWLAYVHLRQGDFTAAAQVLEPGFSLGREMGHRMLIPLSAACLGLAYLRLGRTTDALPLVGEADEGLHALRLAGMYPFIAVLAEAYLLLGRKSDSLRLAEKMRATARAHPQRAWEAWSLKLLADAYAQDDDGLEKSEHAFQQALVFAKELGMRPLQAHCHFGLGKLYKQRHNPQADEEILTAQALYLDMGMTFYAEQTRDWLEPASSNSAKSDGGPILLRNNQISTE